MAGEQYFAERPVSRSARREVRLDLADGSLRLATDAGVFSAAAIDAGTKLLLLTVPPPPPSGDVLDLGCGYGPIALTLARRAPQATVWAADVNERARAARLPRRQTELDAGDAGLERRPRAAPARHHRQEVARQRLVAAVVTLALGALEAVAVDPVRVVMVNDQLVPVPVELERAAVPDQSGAARGRAAPRVEVLRVDRVRARGVLDQRARRVVVARVRRERPSPAILSEWHEREGGEQLTHAP